MADSDESKQQSPQAGSQLIANIENEINELTTQQHELTTQLHTIEDQLRQKNTELADAMARSVSPQDIEDILNDLTAAKSLSPFTVVVDPPPDERYEQEPLDRFRLCSAVVSGAAAKSYHSLTPRPLPSFIKMIRTICLIVVVEAEVRPIMQKYQFERDEELTAQFMHLATVSRKKVNDLNIKIVKVAESKVFNRHYSGYTQSSALAALVSAVIKPDLVISFGTAGGITDLTQLPDFEDEATNAVDHKNEIKLKEVRIGDVIFGSECLFLDRLRSRNQTAFDWGLWGGVSIKAHSLCKDLGLVQGTIGSQVSYNVGKFQTKMIKNANIVALDMEAAPIAQVLNQTNIDFMALKVISNGTYPGNPEKMEDEYHENREMVSKKATEVLVKIIEYLNNKRINEL